MACVCIIVTKLQTTMCDIAGPPGSNPLANACSHLILEYTVRLAIINAVELGRNGSLVFFFLTFIEDFCVVAKRSVRPW